MSQRDLQRRSVRSEQSLPHQTRDAVTRRPKGFLDQVGALVRGFLIRVGLVLVGCVALIAAIWINLNAGYEIVSGLLSPDSLEEIAVSVARLLAPVPGLWLIYRGLR